MGAIDAEKHTNQRRGWRGARITARKLRAFVCMSEDPEHIFHIQFATLGSNLSRKVTGSACGSPACLGRSIGGKAHKAREIATLQRRKCEATVGVSSSGVLRHVDRYCCCSTSASALKALLERAAKKRVVTGVCGGRDDRLAMLKAAALRWTP